MRSVLSVSMRNASLNGKKLSLSDEQRVRDSPHCERERERLSSLRERERETLPIEKERDSLYCESYLCLSLYLSISVALCFSVPLYLDEQCVYKYVEMDKQRMREGYRGRRRAHAQHASLPIHLSLSVSLCLFTSMNR